MTQFNLDDGSSAGLQLLGTQMDENWQAAVELAEKILFIRDRQPRFINLQANEAQRRYAENSEREKRNIVLKARQMGITTWIAGHFF